MRTPSSMPVPAAPRRAAPPRKKAVKSPSPVRQPQILETDVMEIPEAVSGTGADIITHDHDEGGENERKTHAEEPQLSITRKFSDDASPEVLEDAKHVTEEPQSVDILEPEESHTDIDADLVEDARDSPAGIKEVTGAQSVVSRDGVAPDEEGVASPIMPEATDETMTEPEAEDEAARRTRVGERLAKMGAFNPFSAPRRQSSIVLEDSKKTPVGSGDVPSPTHATRRESPRKDSIDSLEGAEFSIDLTVGRPNVPAPPPRAGNSRWNSVDSAASYPQSLPPAVPDSAKVTSTPIQIDSPEQNDGRTKHDISREDKSQDGEY